MNLSSVVRQFDFESAGDFLHALMPTAAVWRGVQLNQHVFRGHADADWQLIPKAFRTPEASNRAQRSLEHSALRDFWIEADRQGLPIAGDRREVRDLWISPVAPAPIGQAILRMAGREELADQIRPWPPQELWEGLALAQHYGIPTRFLDWTRLAMVAAYFAALGAAELMEQAPNNRLAVWACHENILLAGPWLEPDEQLVHLVTVPRAGNPNLHAQHGVFTLTTVGGIANEPADEAPVAREPLEEVLEKVMTLCGAGKGNLFTHMIVEAGAPLRKLTLPVREAPHLLEFLDMLGVSGATVIPGYAGAAHGANERALRKRLLGKAAKA